jgi:hypothetical protein
VVFHVRFAVNRSIIQIGELRPRFRLVVSGILPMAILVILNVNIYLKIGETRKNRSRKVAKAVVKAAVTTAAVPAPSSSAPMAAAPTTVAAATAICNNNAGKNTLSTCANR